MPRGYYTLLYLPSVLRSLKTQLHSDGNRLSFSIWALFGDNRGCVFECGNFGCRTFLFYRKKDDLNGAITKRKYVFKLSSIS